MRKKSVKKSKRNCTKLPQLEFLLLITYRIFCSFSASLGSWQGYKLTKTLLKSSTHLHQIQPNNTNHKPTYYKCHKHSNTFFLSHRPPIPQRPLSEISTMPPSPELNPEIRILMKFMNKHHENTIKLLTKRHKILMGALEYQFAALCEPKQC